MSVLDDAWSAGEDAYDGFQDWNQEGQETLDGPATESPGDVTEDILQDEYGYSEQEAEDAVDSAQNPGEELTVEDPVDYAGDVVTVRDDPETDRWDGQEWLTDQTWFDAVWEGHEDDTRDLPGSNLWGTEDSFLSDPSQATNDSLNDLWAFATGDFEYRTENGDGEGTPEGTDLPWKWIIGGGIVVVLLAVLAPYAELASKGAEVAG